MRFNFYLVLIMCVSIAIHSCTKHHFVKRSASKQALEAAATQRLEWAPSIKFISPGVPSSGYINLDNNLEYSIYDEEIIRYLPDSIKEDLRCDSLVDITDSTLFVPGKRLHLHPSFELWVEEYRFKDSLQQSGFYKWN